MIQCLTYDEARFEAISALSANDGDNIKKIEITFDGCYYWVHRIYVEEIDCWPI
jgi:hypothetical protein